MTPTGRATGKALFAKHGARLLQATCRTTRAACRRFIRHFRPASAS
jgi:3-deoxy-D-manno-octulosonic-acid transferase